MDIILVYFLGGIVSKLCIVLGINGSKLFSLTDKDSDVCNFSLLPGLYFCFGKNSFWPIEK